MQDTPQFLHISSEVLFGGGKIAAECARSRLVGARGAADAQIDPLGIERFERAELFGDDERRVIRQHDAAGADANRARSTGDVPDDDGRRGAGDPGHVVMFGEPVAVVAPALRVPRQVERVAERLRGGPAFDDGRKVEHRETGSWALLWCAPDMGTLTFTVSRRSVQKAKAG